MGACEDKEGKGRRASEVNDEDKLLAPHVNLDSAMVSPALTGSSDEGSAMQKKRQGADGCPPQGPTSAA